MPGRIDRASISQPSPRRFSMSFDSGLMMPELGLNRRLNTIERRFNAIWKKVGHANDHAISLFVFRGHSSFLYFLLYNLNSIIYCLLYYVSYL